jgi:hypothetical protein
MSLVVHGAVMRLVGGASVPTAYARVNATWPLAVLVLEGSRLSLRLRWPGRLFGARDLRVTADELVRVYPIQGFMSPGVGFTNREGHDFYFWTYKGQQVLETLRRSGYPISYTLEKPSKIWRATP